MYMLLAFARLGDVVRRLHAHERIHLHPESLLDAQRHIPGKVGPAIEQTGECGPGNVKRFRRRRDRQARGNDNLRPDEITGMGRVLHKSKGRIGRRCPGCPAEREGLARLHLECGK